MASELVNAATSDKLTEVDWTKNIEICEQVAHDHRLAKDVVKAIKKRLGSKNSNTQLFAVMLLEMLMNNIGDPIHKQVTDAGILPILVKMVKKKSNLPVREKIFLLLDAAQTSVGGASGRFPQYYSSYYELVSAGVQFPQRPHENSRPPHTDNRRPPNEEPVIPRSEKNARRPQANGVSESSILQKAGTALEVLRDVLDTIDTQNPEGAKDEFTLDLVEQCSFQKQRVMHLAVTSRDEKLVMRAVELNEELDRVLRRHDSLLEGRIMSTTTHFNHEEEEEEEPEQLFRRIRKGKACIRPEDEDYQTNRPTPLMGLHLAEQMLHRPLIRPLTVDRHQLSTHQPNMNPKQETMTRLPPATNQESNLGQPAVTIPPPPAKHVERVKFFQENKADGSALNGHMRSLSLHSRDASSSRSGSTDFSD